MNGSAAKLAPHLDLLPAEGPVERRLAQRVLSGLVALRGIALGVASRLVAVKRPDLFATLNGANVPRVREIFGSAPTTVDRYLDWHELLWSLPWASADQPAGTVNERRAWRARVALLDALIYVPGG